MSFNGLFDSPIVTPVPPVKTQLPQPDLSGFCPGGAPALLVTTPGPIDSLLAMRLALGEDEADDEAEMGGRSGAS
jgi:hypothetical protein